MNLLAIVPARAGSVGIPGKALRTVGGVPLLLRTLRIVERSGIADEIRVSTESAELAHFVRLRGYRVVERPAELAEDEIPLLDVARHAAQEWPGPVGIFQPTCPLVRPQTLQRLWAEYRSRGLDWAIAATDDSHIFWRDGIAIGERVNRQQRRPLQRESGAVQFLSPRYLQSGQGNEGLLAIPADEALDIDTPADLLLAERLAARVRIHFVVLMGAAVGTGHFHRSILLAEALSHHRISWEWRGSPPQWARDRVSRLRLSRSGADVVVFDCLAPSEKELLAARQHSRVVVLEDETEASRRYADLLVNALLDPDDLRYAVLRPEFLHLPERWHGEDRRMLVTFGGSDPADLAARCERVLAGVPCQVRLIPPHEDVHMAAELREADLCVTSQGRTVLEAAACGTPCISIAANEREARHVRLPGVTYLGLHSIVTDEMLRHAVGTTLGSASLRTEQAAAASNAVDGRGLDRLVRRIEELLMWSS